MDNYDKENVFTSSNYVNCIKELGDINFKNVEKLVNYVGTFFRLLF